jgi:cysteine desulfurase
MRSYLDHNATSPLRPEAQQAMTHAMAATGNPSSVHADGRAARRLVEDAREIVAALAGAPADAVIFTSGGTEAANLALNGWSPGCVLVSAVEHACVLQAVPDAPRVAVDADGVIDLADLESRLAAVADAADAPALVACMAANNETGVVQPVDDVIRLARRFGARVFVDAVQAAGRIAVDAWDADYLALSAHKIGGPAGVGALIVKPGAPLTPLVRGGGQQGGRRPEPRT